jgi:hypothetical protein
MNTPLARVGAWGYAGTVILGVAMFLLMVTGKDTPMTMLPLIASSMLLGAVVALPFVVHVLIQTAKHRQWGWFVATFVIPLPVPFIYYWKYSSLGTE